MICTVFRPAWQWEPHFLLAGGALGTFTASGCRDPAANEMVRRDGRGEARRRFAGRRQYGAHHAAATDDTRFHDPQWQHKAHLERRVHGQEILGPEENARAADVLDLAFFPARRPDGTVPHREVDGEARSASGIPFHVTLPDLKRCVATATHVHASVQDTPHSAAATPEIGSIAA